MDRLGRQTRAREQEDLHFDEFHLLYQSQFQGLAESVVRDIRTASPDTVVIPEIMEFDDPWDFEEVYGKLYDYALSRRFDRFELAQLREVVATCRESRSAAEAGTRLFAVSRKAKKTTNDTDRLAKYLAKFGLSFKALGARPFAVSMRK